MRNDRDYNNYNDFNRDRDRGRNGEFRSYRSYDVGDGTGSFERASVSPFSYRVRRPDDDYDGSMVKQTDYDHDAARRSRGLQNSHEYQGGNSARHYLGDSDFTSRHTSVRNFNRGDSYYTDRYQPVNRDQYRSEQDFNRSNEGDFDRGRMYGNYIFAHSNRGYKEDNRNRSDSYRSSRDNNYFSDQDNDRYRRDSYRTNDRRENDRNWQSDQKRGIDTDRGYGRNYYNDQQRSYQHAYDSGREYSDERQERPSVKDRYSSSSLHYRGITSLGGDDERNRDRYEGSQYIGRQRSDRKFAGSGIGSSQRYRY